METISSDALWAKENRDCKATVQISFHLKINEHKPRSSYYIRLW